MKFLLTVALFLRTSSVKAQEVALYNKEGKAIAYIDCSDEDQTIYLYNGTPTAVITKSNVYGFNGKHLGWYEKDILRDHDGKKVGATKKAANVYTQYEPYKSYKQRKPFKGYQLYPPYKPYGSDTWSEISFEALLLEGVSK